VLLKAVRDSRRAVAEQNRGSIPSRADLAADRAGRSKKRATRVGVVLKAVYVY